MARGIVHRSFASGAAAASAKRQNAEGKTDFSHAVLNVVCSKQLCMSANAGAAAATEFPGAFATHSSSAAEEVQLNTPPNFASTNGEFVRSAKSTRVVRKATLMPHLRLQLLGPPLDANSAPAIAGKRLLTAVDVKVQTCPGVLSEAAETLRDFDHLGMVISICMEFTAHVFAAAILAGVILAIKSALAAVVPEKRKD